MQHLYYNYNATPWQAAPRGHDASNAVLSYDAWLERP